VATADSIGWNFTRRESLRRSALCPTIAQLPVGPRMRLIGKLTPLLHLWLLAMQRSYQAQQAAMSRPEWKMGPRLTVFGLPTAKDPAGIMQKAPTLGRTANETSALRSSSQFYLQKKRRIVCSTDFSTRVQRLCSLEGLDQRLQECLFTQEKSRLPKRSPLWYYYRISDFMREVEYLFLVNYGRRTMIRHGRPVARSEFWAYYGFWAFARPRGKISCLEVNKSQLGIDLDMVSSETAYPPLCLAKK